MNECPTLDASAPKVLHMSKFVFPKVQKAEILHVTSLNKDKGISKVAVLAVAILESKLKSKRKTENGF